MLSAAARGEFDAVLIEATDRLSRNRADLFWLAERFKFHNITLFTPTGEVSDMQLTFDGHSNEDFIRKLAMRVRRGHDAITREGKVAGNNCYGYDLVPGKSGERVINEAEAAVIRRIFTEYASGMTPRQIVAGLLRDGIPSPTGRPVWNYQGIVGGDVEATGAGFLHREIYRGKIVRNRHKKVKNPETGKRLNRRSDPDELIVVDAPHLKIIDDELWEAAHSVRLARRTKMNPEGYNAKPALPRKQSLLAGLLRCAACNGQMTIVASARGGRVGCSNATYRQSCDHRKTYRLVTITVEAVNKMEKELTDPEFLKRRVRAKALELSKAEKEDSAERQSVQRQLDRLNLQISRLVDAIADGDMPLAEVKEKIKVKEAERVSLQERFRLLGSESNISALQPASMASFGKSVETLCDLLRRNPDDADCRMAFANVIDCVLVHPTPNKAPYDLSMFARVSAIHSLELFPKQRSHEKIVSEEGISRNAGSGNAVTCSGPFN